MPHKYERIPLMLLSANRETKSVWDEVLYSPSSPQDCFTWLISALPSHFPQSLTPVSRYWSHAALALVSSQPPSTQAGTLRELPQCCSWLWSPLWASVLVLGRNIYTVLWLCLQTCSVLGLLNWAIVFLCENCKGNTLMLVLFQYN